jgi:hypothetical protein
VLGSGIFAVLAQDSLSPSVQVWPGKCWGCLAVGLVAVQTARLGLDEGVTDASLEWVMYVGIAACLGFQTHGRPLALAVISMAGTATSSLFSAEHGDTDAKTRAASSYQRLLEAQELHERPTSNNKPARGAAVQLF